MANKTMTIAEAIADIKRKRDMAMQEILLMVEADAKMNTPVRTGTLKRSITHEMKSDENKTVGSVGSNVEYAYWVDRNIPYLSSAVDQNLDKIRKKIAEVMRS